MQTRRYACNNCGFRVTEEQSDKVSCPHCSTVWCGGECCGFFPTECTHAVPDGEVCNECEGAAFR